jgi:hypothetical protein
MRQIAIAISLGVLVAVAAVETANALATRGGVCRTGFDSREGQIRPPDGTAIDNWPAANVTMQKNCRGAVIASFTAEVSVPADGDFIALALQATCLRTGGLANACTPGRVLYGKPGDGRNLIMFANGRINGIASFAAQWILRGLKPGIWRFLVRPAGNDKAFMLQRALTVQSYDGG